MEASHGESSPVYDNFDVDLLVKVLAHTAFSKFSRRPVCYNAQYRYYTRSFLYFLYSGVLLLPRFTLAEPSAHPVGWLLYPPLCIL